MKKFSISRDHRTGYYGVIDEKGNTYSEFPIYMDALLACNTMNDLPKYREPAPVGFSLVGWIDNEIKDNH